MLGNICLCSLLIWLYLHIISALICCPKNYCIDILLNSLIYILFELEIYLNLGWTFPSISWFCLLMKSFIAYINIIFSLIYCRIFVRMIILNNLVIVWLFASWSFLCFFFLPFFFFYYHSTLIRVGILNIAKYE